MDNVVTQTKFDVWFKLEFELVRHQAVVAVPRTGFDQFFLHHMEQLERWMGRGPTGSNDVRPGSAAATGDEVMTKESLLDAKRTSWESTPEIGKPASTAKRRH